ncbi:rod shape-determining protein MreC [Luteimonas sp. MJ204]|uniref:rod shape-determining protein MreC n=1 Tax=Luteimonas sp. MJ145 TaxID=3129234 RepID=UPI0031BA33BE
MSHYAGPAAPRSSDVAGTLKLLAYLALSVTLLVLDHRGDWLAQARGHASVALQPVWWLAGLPARLGESVRDDAASRTRLSEENRHLRNELLLGAARQARLQVEAEENARLRGLLGAAERGSQDVQLAPILDVDLDPTRQRLMLNAGTRAGVRSGQAVIDAGGLVGQVIEATPTTAVVLLLTDPDHAVPVAVARTGVRLIVYGTGRSDVLELRNVPLSSDVRTGDVVITSGLGGRFPPGFPVGRIAALRPDDSRAFLVGDVDAAAQLDRGRDVLLLREQPLLPDRAPLESEAGAGPEADAAPPADAAPSAADAPADASPADPSPAPGAAR